MTLRGSAPSLLLAGLAVGLLPLAAASCTFPEVGLAPGEGLGGTGPGVATSTIASGDPTSSTGEGGTTGAGGETGSTGSAGGGGNTTAGQGGDGGAGQGGDGGAGEGGATTGQGGDGQGGDGQGGDGGAGQGGDGGAAATSASSASSSSTGGGGCPVGCEVCGDACPVDATPDDCDADGDPDVGDAPDCHRCNDRVNHQQTTFFVDPYQRIGGGTSFDYNCNGSPDRDHPNDTDGCTVAVGDCPGTRVYLLANPPSCGTSAAYDPCSDSGLGCSGGPDGQALVGCN